MADKNKHSPTKRDALKKELFSKTKELGKYHDELTLLQTRLKISEITEETFRIKSQKLIEKIQTLEKRVDELQKLVSDKSADEPSHETPSPSTEESPELSDDVIKKNFPNVEEGGGTTDKHKNIKLTEILAQVIRKNPVLSGILLLFLFTILVAGVAIVLMPRSGPNIGNLAPDFAMQLDDDKVASLSAFRGKDVLLVFWDRDFWDDDFFYVNGIMRKLYSPAKLNELYLKYSQNDLAIVAIASGTNDKEIDKLVSDYDVNFPIIIDSFGSLRQSYNIVYEPTYVFIDRSGKIQARVGGPIINLSDFEQIIYNMDKHNRINSPKPPITDILVQPVNEKIATVSWITREATTTQVDVDGKYIETVITPSPVTLHSLTLRNLSPNTSYCIRILYNIDNINVSKNSFAALANTIVSKRLLFTTPNKDTTYPEITGINISFIADSSVTITWKTDEPATGDIDFGIDKNYTNTASQGEKLTIWHTVRIDGLKPDTQYYLKLRSKDASGKETSLEIEPIKTYSTIEIAPKIGKRAPDFKLNTLDGDAISLSQYFGKKILLNFWYEGCPACEVEMPLLQAIYDKYSRDQLIILAVNIYGDLDKVKYYVSKENLKFPVLIDSEGQTDRLYNIPSFPTTYFIDCSGIIREIKTEHLETISEIDEIINKLE